MSLEEQRVQIRGKQVCFVATGSGDPVLLLHGGANTWQEWRANILPLSRSFRVIAPSLPGFGGSSPLDLPYSAEGMAEFLGWFMDALALPKASLVGHSLGGAIALALYRRYPERVKRLVLVACDGLGGATWWRKAVAWSTSLLRWLRGDPWRLRILRASRYPRDLETYLPQVAAPTLIVWGKRDPYLPVALAYRASRLIPASRLVVLPCGHAPQRQRAEDFNRAVADFLQEDSGVG